MNNELEKKVNHLSQNIFKLSDNPTNIRLKEIEKDVKDIRVTLTDMMSYIHSIRIW
jgi:hypothetical protein